MKKILAVSIMAALSASVTAKPENKGFDVANFDQLKEALEGKATPIQLHKTIKFTCGSDKSVVLNGNGHTLLADGNNSALEIFNCESVKISDITFEGNNSPDDYNLDTYSMVGGSAIIIRNISSDADLNVDLKKITVKNFGDHGIYVTDCINDDCGDGNSGEGKGTDGSISLKLFNVGVIDGGFGGQDADGVRVNERGVGNIHFQSTQDSFEGYGADGVELDEAGEGNVEFFVTGSNFINNGEYCALEGIGAVGKCNDDDEPDVDDGFDIDEAGDGDIVGTIQDSNVEGNFDEGLDFDEAGDGNIELTVTNVDAIDNADEAVKASEEDAGDTIVTITDFLDLNSDDTNQDLQVEQEGAGKLVWNIFDSVFDDAKVLSDENAESKLYIEGSTFDDVKYEGAIDEDNIEIVDSVYDEIEDDN